MAAQTPGGGLLSDDEARTIGLFLAYMSCVLGNYVVRLVE